MKIVSLIAVLSALSIGATASTASFDCAKASSPTEKAICSHPSLAKMDRELASVYHAALKRADPEERPKMKSAQRSWLAHREACKGELRCIEGSYQRRITQLQIDTGAVPVPDPAAYRCKNGGRLTVFFYNDTFVPSVVVNSDDARYLLLRSESGSGAKYRGDGVEFWEHHGEATLVAHGKKSVCREVGR